MSSKKEFGKTLKGELATIYAIGNEDMCAEITDFGATLVKLWVRDSNGKKTDVVLGHEKLDGYFDNPECMGSTIAPSANRIFGARFEIDGVEYKLALNDGGINNLHSDLNNGGHKRVWTLKEMTNDSLLFALEMADGELGFPGNRKMTVRYTVDKTTLRIEYTVSSDKKTVFNPTNHSYFNVAGHASGSVFSHKLKLDCDYFTPVRAGLVPTGEIAEVKGTPFDFTTEKTIGEDFDLNCEQLALTKGYDHNFVINGYDGSLKHFARLSSDETGIVLDGFTTMPGVQVYTGNYVNADEGTDNVHYDENDGVGLETQFFPNAVNQPDFISPVIDADREYHYVTEYAFSVQRLTI